MGNAFAGRVASSLLNACKMKELITYDLNEYENLAIQLALDKEKLNSLKKKIINNKDSVLFNSKLFTKNLENAYKNVYEIYNSDLKKRDIYIN